MAWFPRCINGKQGTRHAAKIAEEAARRHVALEGNNGNGPQAAQTSKGTRTAHKPPPASRAMTRQPAHAMRICWSERFYSRR